ncbi:MAG: hypothetical protein WKF58_05865 [Ilumatobacteraceae bacterium]
MGLLAGTTQFGTDIFTTDLWFSLPFADAGDAVKALPPARRLRRAARAGCDGGACDVVRPDPHHRHRRRRCCCRRSVASPATRPTSTRPDATALVTSPDELDLDEDDGSGTSSGSDRGDDESRVTTRRMPRRRPTATAVVESPPPDTAGPATTAPRPTSPPTTTPPRPLPAKPGRRRRPAPPDPRHDAANGAGHRRPRLPGGRECGDQRIEPIDRPGSHRDPVRAADAARARTRAAGWQGQLRPQGSAVIPFYVTSTPTTANGPHKVSLRWSQSLSGRADTGRFPMTIEFHDFNGTRCTSATNSDLLQTGAVYEWARLVRDEEGAGNGYIIVENYWDANGKPVGRSSALLSVIPVVNDEFTTNTFVITGSDIIRYEDPQTGDTYGVMRIAR